MGIPCFKTAEALAGKVSFHTSSWALLAVLAFFSYVKSVWTNWQRLILKTVLVLQSHIPHNREWKKSPFPFPFLHECFCTFVSHIWSVKKSRGILLNLWLSSLEKLQACYLSKFPKRNQRRSDATCEFCLSKRKTEDLNMWLGLITVSSQWPRFP